MVKTLSQKIPEIQMYFDNIISLSPYGDPEDDYDIILFLFLASQRPQRKEADWVDNVDMMGLRIMP